MAEEDKVSEEELMSDIESNTEIPEASHLSINNKLESC